MRGAPRRAHKNRARGVIRPSRAGWRLTWSLVRLQLGSHLGRPHHVSNKYSLVEFQKRRHDRIVVAEGYPGPAEFEIRPDPADPCLCLGLHPRSLVAQPNSARDEPSHGGLVAPAHLVSEGAAAKRESDAGIIVRETVRSHLGGGLQNSVCPLHDWFPIGRHLFAAFAIAPAAGSERSAAARRRMPLKVLVVGAAEKIPSELRRPPHGRRWRLHLTREHRVSERRSPQTVGSSFVLARRTIRCILIERLLVTA